MRLQELYENKNDDLLKYLNVNYVDNKELIDVFDENVEDFYIDLHGKFKLDFDNYFRTTDEDDLYDIDCELAHNMPIQLLKLFIRKYMKPDSGDTEMYMTPISKSLLPADTWLIHFTNFAEEIKNNGFTKGTRDIENLAFTNLKSDKLSDGYNFAVRLKSPEADQLFKNKRYGLDAIIFQSSGVEIHHRYDDQPQVIFWGKYVNPQNMKIAKRIKNELVFNGVSYKLPSDIVL